MIRRQYINHVLLALAVAVGAAFPASIAVVLQALWSSMTADLGQGSTVQLILGAMPTSLYLMAPIACVITLCWLFWLNCQNVSLQVMFAAGMSIFYCALPAIFLAVTFTGAAVVDAWVVAPRGVTMVEDVKYALKRDIAFGALQEGRFHSFEFDNSVVAMSFRKKLGNDRFEGVFLSVTPKAGKPYTVISRTAEFKKTPLSLSIHFAKGSRQTTDFDARLVVTTFDTFIRTFPIKGAVTSARRPVTILEVGFSQLVDLAFSGAPHQAWMASLARSELAKRTLVPLMNFTHALLALGILFVIGPASVRLGSVHLKVILGIVALHVAAVTGIELFARGSFFMHGLLIAVMAVEVFAGVALMMRAGRTTREFRLPPRRRPSAPSLQQ